MATKTITIDSEACGRLKSAKQDGESFSRVIKRVVPPRFDVDAWLESISADPMSEKAVRAVEEHVAGRRKRSRRRT